MVLRSQVLFTNGLNIVWLRLPEPEMTDNDKDGNDVIREDLRPVLELSYWNVCSRSPQASWQNKNDV